METAPKAIDINAVPTREAKLVSDELFSGGEFMVARRNIILSLHYSIIACVRTVNTCVRPT